MSEVAAGRSRVAVAVLATLLLVAGAAAAFWIVEQPAAPRIDADNAALVSHGEDLYRQHCAECHGRSLEGQPDWRSRRPDGRLPAPPHDETGHTWHHADDMLFGIVKEGYGTGRFGPPGYQSDMPAYGGTLSDGDIVAVLAYIKSTWPAQQREHQARLSQN